MGGTSQGNEEILQSGQDLARVFGALNARRLNGAEQSLSLTDQLADDDPQRIAAVNAYRNAAAYAYGRRNVTIPTKQVGGDLVPGTGTQATPPQMTSTPGAATGEGGTEGGPGRGAPAYTPGTPATPPQYTPTSTVPYVPHVNKILTFADLARAQGWDRDGSIAPEQLAKFGMLPATQVLAINNSLLRTDPETGLVTGGLIPGLAAGGKGQRTSTTLTRADAFTTQMHTAFQSGDTVLLHNAAQRATAWRAAAVAQDPALDAVLPHFDQAESQYTGQLSHATARIDLQQADTAYRVAADNVRAARVTFDGSPTSRSRLVDAYRGLQTSIANYKRIAAQAGTIAPTAGTLTPEQEAGADVRAATPTPQGQPVKGKDGQTYIPYNVPGKPQETRFGHVGANGQIDYWTNQMPGENRITVNVGGGGAPTPTGDTYTDSNGRTWHEVRVPEKGGGVKTYFEDDHHNITTAAPVGSPWSGGRGATAAGADMKGWSDTQLQDFLTNPATTKGQIDDHNHATAELKRRGYTQDAKGNWAKPGHSNHIPAGAPTATGKGGHQIYYDGKVWRDAQTGDEVK